MCSPQTLYHNEHGYVAWCAACRHMSLAFGTIVMALTPEQMCSFTVILARDTLQYAGRMEPGEKAFLYNTDSRHTKLVLSFVEVERLQELLNRSWLMYQVRQCRAGRTRLRLQRIVKDTEI